MANPSRERVRRYRERQRQQGKVRLTVAIEPEARAALDQLLSSHPALTIDSTINGLLLGTVALPRNKQPTRQALPRNDKPVRKPLRGNDPPAQSLLPSNSQALPGNAPCDRAALAKIGHQLKRDGMRISEIAEHFNANGWTPAAIPRQAGVKPRSDAAARWTVKTVSQLLTRDYPAPRRF